MSLDGVGSEASLAHVGVIQFLPTCMIVEDQTLIGLSLEGYLEETGFRACPVFPSAAEALAWLTTNAPTVAVLDYALKDGPCTTLTGVLAQRSIPFIIYSGYKRSVVRRELQNVPWISKPCDREALLAALMRVAPVLSTWSTRIKA